MIIELRNQRAENKIKFPYPAVKEKTGSTYGRDEMKTSREPAMTHKPTD